MIFNEKKAKRIIKKKGLSKSTLRTWKHRNTIPNKHISKQKLVTLESEITDTKLETAKRKFPKFAELVTSRKFKANQKKAYYNKCLISLCREAKTFGKNGKLDSKL